MSQQVIITSVTANTPVNIYYCDSMSANCVYVSTVSVFPYTFQVPAPYDEEDIVIKIIDTQSCDVGHIIYITPTPTPSLSPSQTQTPSQTVTNTPTHTQTPTNTPTYTQTPSHTPTNTSTPTVTPVVVPHLIGNSLSSSSANTCNDIMTIVNYYTYISQANLTPVVSATVFQTLVNGVLYNPFNGGNKYLKMKFGNDFYVVQINSTGQIMSYQLCVGLVTPTPTNTATPTHTSTPTNSPTQTNTPSSTSASGSLFQMFLFESGSDVILSGSGTFNITNLVFKQSGNFTSFITPNTASLSSGTNNSTPIPVNLYTGSTLTFPSNFGTSGISNANSGGGTLVSVIKQGGTNYLVLGTGYTPNTFTQTQSTFTGTTLATLGATNGTYTYTWGSGVNSGTLTLKVGP